MPVTNTTTATHDSWDASAIHRLDSLFESIDRAIDYCIATNKILAKFPR